MSSAIPHILSPHALAPQAPSVRVPPQLHLKTFGLDTTPHSFHNEHYLRIHLDRSQDQEEPMETPPPLRPINTRQHSKVPGSFETDDEFSPTKSTYDDAASFKAHSRHSSLASKPIQDVNSPDQTIIEDQDRNPDESGVLDAKEIERQLMDVESSFLPDPSPTTAQQQSNAENSSNVQFNNSTPPSTYKTPAPQQVDRSFSNSRLDHYPNTSSLETMSSSPTAAAAARTVSRVVSQTSMDGYMTAEEDGSTTLRDYSNEEASTPRKPQPAHVPPEEDVPTPKKSSAPEHPIVHVTDTSTADATNRKSARRRPTYLSSRYSSHRSSYSSNHTIPSGDDADDLTTGAEYALQTGGGAPLASSSSSRPDDFLARSISLGSMASGVSKLSDDEDRADTPIADLEPLLEESSPPSSILTTRQIVQISGPQTPKPSSFSPETITDTVINQHVRNLEIPGTITRSFMSKDVLDRPMSPEKRSGMPTPAGRVKNMTLKEQSNVIDKLQKENWKLKLKVYFMDQMLNERSDEAVKAMISENVELKTFKFSATKEIRSQKRSIKELEAKLREREARLASRANAPDINMRQPSHSAGFSELETEITYLREKIESYELDIEKLRADNAIKEGEKRRLAEMVRSVGNRSAVGSEPESREEVAVWKDLLESETIRREQMEEDNRKLQEELWRLKAEGSQPAPSSRSERLASRSRHRGSSEAGSEVNTISRSSSTLVEQLRQENAELRRDLGAQTSMLTSRNREKERLYVEIEELKMVHRRDSRSVGDNLFDRSASRAQGRSASRTSSQSRITQIGESEREALEKSNGELRDNLAETRMQNQELSESVEKLLDELEPLENIRNEFNQLQQTYDELKSSDNQELFDMQTERDDALQQLEDTEISFEELKEEAQVRIDELEADLDNNRDFIKKLTEDLDQREEESKALRNEIRMTSEGMDRVEADVQTRIRRIKELELENEDINRELENIENSLIDANTKNEKLSVELESRQSECAFLREEQDGCMLKIGDLETALKAAQASLKSEKDHTKDLDARLADERHQREVVGSKEKQEVQKIINDLNREATSAKEESRGLKKDLETRGIELDGWKQRLAELEQGLQEVLGDANGSKSNYIFAITEMQKTLETTVSELSTARHGLSEKDRILSNRDALLESHGLESRKLSELLEKERSARRADRAQHEQWHKTTLHSTRTISQKDSRIGELENNREADRKRLVALEREFKSQLVERNSLLLSLWNKLSSLCGTDWQNQNSLVSGHLPTPDVVQNLLPGFSKNLLLAVRTIESVIGGFKGKIKAVEKDLMKDYQQLEHNLDLRIKRLDRLESAVQHSRVSGAANAAPEIAKLRGENRLLKSDIAALHKQEQVLRSRQNAVSIEPIGSSSSPEKDRKDPASRAARAAAVSSLTRHYSSTAVETLQKEQHAAADAIILPSQPLDPSQARWIHRLKDLERRLKAEREARLQDRKGARERLEKGEEEREELRAALERERQKNQAQ